MEYPLPVLSFLPADGAGLQAFAGAVFVAATTFAVAVREVRYGWAWNRK